MEPLLAPEWNEDTKVNVIINTDVEPGFLEIDTETSWFNLKYVPIIYIDSTKIIAEGLFMFNYESTRTYRFIKNPLDLLIKPYLDEDKTIRNPDVKINRKKLQQGDGMLRKLSFEINRLTGTLKYKPASLKEVHWMDMPTNVLLFANYTGWSEARKCQKNKKLF